MNKIPYPTSQLPLSRQLAFLHMYEQFMLEAIDVQQYEPQVRAHAQAMSLIRRILAVVKRQAARLARMVASCQVDQADLQEVAGKLAGFFTRFFRKTRARDVSAILRHDHMLLKLAVSGHATLHQTGWALHEQQTVGLAQTHRRELRALVREIQSLSPEVATAETEPANFLAPPAESQAAAITVPAPQREEAFGELGRLWRTA